MRRFVPTLFLSLAASALFCTSASAETEPLKALLIAGGCCHDYEHQYKILSDGIQSRANVQVDVIWTDDKTTTPDFSFYKNPDWAKGYDIVIHDECAASTKDLALVENVVNVHKKIPAVNLHCAMHSFRTGTDVWFKYLGLQSASHGPQEPIELRYVDSEHPITKTLSDWTTVKEELYNNINIFDAHPIAMGKQLQKQKDGTVKEFEYVVAWTNETQGARSFSTTIGHNNDTVADSRYLDLLTRGLLWACNKLEPAYQTPFKGTNKVTFIKAAPQPAKPKVAPAAAATPPPAPKDATLVTVTSSSEESGKSNFAWKALDNNPETRWCANSPDYPQWLKVELDKPRKLSGYSVSWENQGIFRYKIEGSKDDKTWTTLFDGSGNKQAGPNAGDFVGNEITTTEFLFIKLTALGKNSGGWASIREFALKGEGIKALAAKVAPAQLAEAKKVDAKSADPYAKEGNLPPSIVRLTAQQEADVLKDVKVPEGFDVSLFATPPAANYPVFIAAAPNGDVYVSSDGNGSLGRAPHRGRILRLRDTDGDGRADQVTEFVKDVDAPRGLVWDHDRLYLVHPPHLSVFIDKDGDGVAEESKVLVKDIAFGYKDRPADHTTNGLSLGIDGWLYIAGGDFGFMNAEGTDGTKLQHRGGGVIRVRPDGTGLQVFATGTRNILEVAISPTMDIFARDNTNDGGGWDVRFHHITGLSDHGYPRLYKNFNNEIIQPLADYGGGSGCGAVYIDEPGFPAEWNNAPFTDDWGTGALWKHTVKAKGATFEETEAPKPFIKMTRPTDSDVDAMSAVYQASWKGATFNWEGPDVGYIVRVTPKGYKPEPLPDFDKASDAELVKLLESPSNRRRMEAQRALLRRPWSQEMRALTALVNNKSIATATRVAATYLWAQHPGKDTFLVLPSSPTAEDIPVLVANKKALHVKSKNPEGNNTIYLGESTVQKNEEVLSKGLQEELIAGEIISAANSGKIDKGTLKRLSKTASEFSIPSHMLVQAGRKYATAKDVWEVYDSTTEASIQGLTLQIIEGIHSPESVNGLIERLNKTSTPELRKGLLSALCRLNFQEGEWKGDSWGTRPDTRGPYYQPEAWSETPKIAEALKAALAKATPDEAAFLVSEMNRNRIQSNDALDRILVLAKQDPKLIPDATAQLANAETIPADGIPLLIQAAQNPESSAPVLADAITALAKTDSAAGIQASLVALVSLEKTKGFNKQQEAGTTAFLGSPKLENHHQLLEAEAEKVGTPTAAWADCALLTLSARTTGSPESRELSGKALDQGWLDVKRRTQILKAVARLKHNPYADKVLTALDDADKGVAAAAKNAANAMKLQKKTKESGPLISTLKPEDVIAQILKIKGDVALGEQLFSRQTCIACHTTNQEQAQKGPYLGNIAQTYKRAELAQNILDPNKTIAQGFASEVFTLKDGTQQLGFITLESADQVKIRNIAAQEFTYATKDIAKREKLPISMMPPGLVGNLTVVEFASLLDYLEALSKK